MEIGDRDSNLSRKLIYIYIYIYIFNKKAHLEKELNSRQLSKLCSLFSIQDVNLHMSGIALTLADDRVADVRCEAVKLVSTIVGALVAAEWEEIKVNRNIDSGHMDVKSKKEKTQSFLSEQFVDDIVSSFAKTQKWTRRQT